MSPEPYITGDEYNHLYITRLALLRTVGGTIAVLVGFSLHFYFQAIKFQYQHVDMEVRKLNNRNSGALSPNCQPMWQ